MVIAKITKYKTHGGQKMKKVFSVLLAIALIATVG